MKIVVFLILPKPLYCRSVWTMVANHSQNFRWSVFLPVSHHVNDVTSVAWQDLKSLYPR